MSGFRRRPGRLGPYVEGYRARLLELGYSPLSVANSLAALAHLGRWMERRDVDVEQLDGGVIDAFLADHVDSYGHLPTAGLLPLLQHLRDEAVVGPEPAATLTPLEQLLTDCQEWLVVERALAPETVRGYVRLAGDHARRRSRTSPMPREGSCRPGPAFTSGRVSPPARKQTSLARWLSPRGETSRFDHRGR